MRSQSYVWITIKMYDGASLDSVMRCVFVSVKTNVWAALLGEHGASGQSQRWHKHQLSFVTVAAFSQFSQFVLMRMNEQKIYKTYRKRNSHDNITTAVSLKLHHLIVWPWGQQNQAAKLMLYFIANRFWVRERGMTRSKGPQAGHQ